MATVDRHSDTWIAVRDRCRESIANAQEIIEQQGLDIETTEYERGVIFAMRDVLALGEPPVAQPRFIVEPDY